MKGLQLYMALYNMQLFNYLFSLLVTGCDFQHDAPQIDLGDSLEKAVIMGNIITVRL